MPPGPPRMKLVTAGWPAARAVGSDVARNRGATCRGIIPLPGVRTISPQNGLLIIVSALPGRG